MAFISKEEVQEKSKKLKEINKKYGVKATFSGSNSSTLKLTISSGTIDFIANSIETTLNSSSYTCSDTRYYEEQVIPYLKEKQNLQVNHYYLDSNFSGSALEYLQEAYAIMKEGWWDESDSMSDYFCTAWYNSIEIGKWNKPYILKGN